MEARTIIPLFRKHAVSAEQLATAIGLKHRSHMRVWLHRGSTIPEEHHDAIRREADKLGIELP